MRAACHMSYVGGSGLGLTLLPGVASCVRPPPCVQVLTVKGLQMGQISKQIEEDFSGGISCLASDDNADSLVLRIRVIMDDEQMVSLH